MKLNQETVAILKTFALINSNLVIKPGKKITTMSATKDILAEYEGEDEFDETFAVFNLSEFLGAFGSFQDPELELESKQCIIKQGKQKVKYTYADESYLITPKKDIKMPSSDVEVELSQDLLQRMQKMAAVLSVEDFSIIGDGDKVSVKVCDVKNNTNNEFEVDLEQETTDNFRIDFKIDKLKLFPSDYVVEISSKKISKWKSKNINLSVFIAVEATSQFN